MSLETIGITNGEWAQASNLAMFLEWMKAEKLPIPENSDELDSLLTKWVLRCRKLSLEALVQEGKITQKSFNRMMQQRKT